MQDSGFLFKHVGISFIHRAFQQVLSPLKSACQYLRLELHFCRLLTGAVEDVSKKSGLNERFLGLIILPIAGNACEHITAIFVAVKNKMDLAIGVALGSSIQVSLY